MQKENHTADHFCKFPPCLSAKILVYKCKFSNEQERRTKGGNLGKKTFQSFLPENGNELEHFSKPMWLWQQEPKSGLPPLLRMGK